MTKKLNTLHISSLSIWDLGKNKGRVSTYLPLKGFIDKGHKVNFLTIDKRQKSGNIDGIAVKQIWLPFQPIRKKYLHNLTRLLTYPITTICIIISGLKTSKKSKVDVIYAHSVETALGAFLLSKILNSKYILRLYGFPEFKKENIIHKIIRLDRWIALKIKAHAYILTNDGTNADIRVKSYGVANEKIHFLKNGINKEWINKKSCKDFKKLIAPNNEHILLSVSRLVDWKQVDIIIKAMLELLKLNNNTKLVIIGDGIERNNLESLANKLNVIDNIIFTGAIVQEEIFDYLNIADVFISMNALSSMSNPVYEAMICKKTVIALNTGNTTELIKNNETGILLNPDQIDQLPFVMSEILNNDGKRNKIGENAQNFILENWPSWEERVKQEIEIVEQLCSHS